MEIRDDEERQLTKSEEDEFSKEEYVLGKVRRLDKIRYLILGFLLGLLACELLSESNGVKNDDLNLKGSFTLENIANSSKGGYCKRDFSLETNLMQVLNSLNMTFSRSDIASNAHPGCGGESPSHLGNTVKDFEKYSFISLDLTTPVWRRSTVYFRAKSSADTLRNFGGDEFVLTFLGWTAHGVTYKSASTSKDYSNGTYSVTLDIPHAVTDFQLSLTHLYTCYSGLVTQAKAKTQNGLVQIPNGQAGPFNLNFRPASLVPIVTTNSFRVSDAELSTGYQCPPSQDGVDGMRNVIWVEKHTHAGADLSTKASWHSACCSTAGLKYPYQPGQKYRIGDSTMPGRNVEVGDIFRERNFHNRWIDFLSSTMKSAPAESTVLINSGLHFLNHYNTPDVAKLVTRLLCQLAVFYKGKIILVGSVPVQQALYGSIDGEKDGSVLWLNKLLHDRIVQQGKGRLSDICLDPEVNVTSLAAEPDSMGNLKSDSASTFANEPDHIAFLQQLNSLDLANAYDSRNVLFAHIHDVILARPEAYRTHDKIHDAGDLFFGEHARYIKELETLRALAPP